MENYDDYNPVLDTEIMYESEADFPDEKLNPDLQDLGRQYLE